MADSAPGYGRRPDDPQCYNCGQMGHWAVGCPEPTRQTPAGLEAWRNAPHAGSGARDNRGGQKKTKGPIITRYGPPNPQAPDYTSHNAPSAGWNQYREPPPQPLHPAPLSYGHSQPPPPLLPPPGHYPQYPAQSFQQPSGYYQSSGYSPPPSHGYATRPPPPQPPPPRHDYHSHAGHQPPPSGSATSYPPYYGYPAGLPPSMPSGPPPPSARPPEPSRRQPPSHSPPGQLPHHPFPSQRSRTDHSSPQRDRRSHSSVSNQRRQSGSSPPGPPIGMARLDMIAHGLPPKPPQSKVDQNELRRDNSNPQSQNKQQGNRGNNRNQQNQGEQRQKKKKKNRRNRQKDQSNPQVQDSRQEPVSTERQPSVARSEHTQENGDKDASAAMTEDKSTAVDGLSTETDAKVVQQAPQTAEKEELPKESEPQVDRWEEEAIFKEPEPTHPPDEVGKPLPAYYTEDIILPRKWNANCIESEFFDADKLEDFTKPIHETEHWGLLQYDPAFCHNGMLPSGDLLSSILKKTQEARQAGGDEKAERVEPSHATLKQPRAGDEPSSQDRQSKRKRSVDSAPTERNYPIHNDTQLRDTRRPPSSHGDRRSESPKPASSSQRYPPPQRISPPQSHERRRSPEPYGYSDRRRPQDRRRSRSPTRRRRSPDSRRSRTPDRRRRSPDTQRSRTPDRRRRFSDLRQSRTPERRRRSWSRSRRSSYSSALSRSSSLNSLDRGLLGISTPGNDEKEASDNERARPDQERPPKPKRRRAQVDSAYSRRW